MRPSWLTYSTCWNTGRYYSVSSALIDGNRPFQTVGAIRISWREILSNRQNRHLSVFSSQYARTGKALRRKICDRPQHPLEDINVFAARNRHDSGRFGKLVLDFHLSDIFHKQYRSSGRLSEILIESSFAKTIRLKDKHSTVPISIAQEVWAIHDSLLIEQRW